MSLRHTISSTPCKFSNANRSFRHPDINTASATCLAEVVPAVFRPGYMQVSQSGLQFCNVRHITDYEDPNRQQAISQRGPLISRMASSLSKICLRSHSQNLLCHSFTGKDLHIQLWTLLQKRSWPTTELEPLGQKELAIFSRPNGDEGTTLFESERDCNDAIGGLVKGTDADGDEDMLDDQFPKPVRVLSVPLFEDDDLFSSSGSTPLLSQSTMDEMMLEDVGEAEEMLLDDCDKYPSGQSLIPTSPCSDEEERAEKASRVQDMEEDGDFGMLF
ncbi:MAG: hypothetical protein LQ352_001200 [Teloschistes flavicans]|nr:MAG: hypothetical protein LQ352_001200 [Teloschistes flavicans]